MKRHTIPDGARPSLKQIKDAIAEETGKRVNPKKQRKYKRHNLVHDCELQGANRTHSPIEYGMYRVTNKKKRKRLEAKGMFKKTKEELDDT